MRERAEPILKIACLILAAFVLYQFAGIFLRINPLHGVVVPALPALAASTNNPSGGGRGTNLAVSMLSAAIKGTNNPISAGTNNASSVMLAGTNSIAPPVAIAKETNLIAHDAPAKTETNVVSHLQTNSAPVTTVVTNGTNVLVAAMTMGTNMSRHLKPGMPGANFIPPEMAGGNFNPFAPRGGRADVPPAIQARINRIVDSEILGPVMHPQPMALLGIAGDVAFLRTASGQTGLVKEGDSLGELKLLKIGINRVLVEQDGQKNELTIFSGFGGESLLPKQNETHDENNHP